MENVRAFNPPFIDLDNATVLWLGLRAAAALRWVTEILARFPAGHSAPRVDTKEPETHAERRITHYSANVRSGDRSVLSDSSEKIPDAEPLQLRRLALSRAEASRTLPIVNLRSASGARCRCDGGFARGGSVFSISTWCGHGKKPEERRAAPCWRRSKKFRTHRFVRRTG